MTYHRMKRIIPIVVGLALLYVAYTLQREGFQDAPMSAGSMPMPPAMPMQMPMPPATQMPMPPPATQMPMPPPATQMPMPPPSPQMPMPPPQMPMPPPPATTQMPMTPPPQMPPPAQPAPAEAPPPVSQATDRIAQRVMSTENFQSYQNPYSSSPISLQSQEFRLGKRPMQRVS